MEDWIDIIRQRLQEAESPLPPGDWEAFEASALPTKRPRVLPWVISALAAAVVAVVLLIPRQKEEPVPEQSLASVERVEPDASVAIAEVLPSVSPVRPSALSSTPFFLKPTTVPPSEPAQVSAEEPISQNPVAEQEPDTTEEVIDEPVDEPSVPKETDSTEESAWKDVFESEHPSGAKSRHRITISPHFGSTGSRSRTFDYDPLSANTSSAITGEVLISDSGIRPIETLPIRHSLPLSFGLEISYFPSSRMALTSGLELSIYNSVRTIPSLGETRQRVHYLGIPLKADWVVWQSGRFSAWLGAGGQLDRCIRARINNQSVQDKTLNWSVLADASLQFALTEHLGLYVQPEVSWYFKPTQPVLQTYRTEHPLMFTVGAGLRIGF